MNYIFYKYKFSHISIVRNSLNVIDILISEKTYLIATDDIETLIS